MTPEAEIDFLTGYIRSLAEETRHDSAGPRYGFDHIIYELAVAQNLIPVRLSFFRQGGEELVRPKKEAEHGVDQSFVSRDGKKLLVFVLKDEVLNYKNWTKASFDTDLRRAREQDLSAPEFALIEEVCVILAYNKDDNEEGIESWEKYVRSSGTHVGDKAALTFQRWNLTAITEKVRDTLLTPSLLPENFFRRFTYLCWQVGDFVHNSPQWREVLLPDWREFLAAVLSAPVSERNVRLISVALIVLRSQGKRRADGTLDPSFETGWLDLMEYAVLALWRASSEVDDTAVRNSVFEIWLKYYLAELERYYSNNIDRLTIEHSLQVPGGMLQEGASSFLAYWHMARLGLLAMAASEMPRQDEDSHKGVAELVGRIADWIVQLLNANPACQRPVLDIHHVEIFLVWRALVICGRWEDALNWFHSLFERLLYRRLGQGGMRVIDYGNSWESLFEYLGSGEEPYAGFGKSSYLLLMVLELCLGAPDAQGESLASVIHHQLILGKNADGSTIGLKDHVELMGWIPPDDWAKRILSERVDDGTSLPTHFSDDDESGSFLKNLRAFIDNSRKECSFQLLPWTPPSALVLACIKNASPLPNEFWRRTLFGPVGSDGKDESPAIAA